MPHTTTTTAGFPTSITITIGDTLLHAATNTITMVDSWNKKTETVKFDTEYEMRCCVRAFLSDDCGEAFRSAFPSFAS